MAEEKRDTDRLTQVNASEVAMDVLPSVTPRHSLDAHSVDSGTPLKGHGSRPPDGVRVFPSLSAGLSRGMKIVLVGLCMVSLVLIVLVGLSLHFISNNDGDIQALRRENARLRSDAAHVRSQLPVNFAVDHTFATSGARDGEFFTIDGVAFLSMSNSRNNAGDTAIGSVVMRFNEDTQRFVHYQDIPTFNAHDSDSFTIGDDAYLVFANRNDGPSEVWKWNPADRLFTKFQELPTVSGRDVDVFTLADGSIHMVLVVSEDRSGPSVLNVADSLVYRWDPATRQFTQFQAIPTAGARDVEAFVIGGVQYLAFANTKSDDIDPGTGSVSRNVPSTIWRWDAGSGAYVFDHQLSTSGAYDFEYFSLPVKCTAAGSGAETTTTQHFVSVAYSTNGVSRDIPSEVFRFNPASAVFESYQNLTAHGARDTEFFSIKQSRCAAFDPESCTTRYLVVANHENTHRQNDLDSVLYKWSAETLQFERFQTLPSLGVRDWEFFTLPRGVTESPTYHLLSANNKVNGSLWEVSSAVYASIGELADAPRAAVVPPCPF